MHFFSSIVENLDIKRQKIGSDSVVDNTTDPTLKAILKYRKHPSIITINDRYKGKDTFNFNEVHVTEIKNQILKLNKRKATQSYDSLTRVIIENADMFSEVLCNNFNNCNNLHNFIVSSDFPQYLKPADITSLHKKGKRTLKENYRPVRILPNLSKIYEKIMFTQMTSSLKPFFQMSMWYSKRFGTQKCLLAKLKKWKRSVDKGKTLGALLIDL